MLVTMPHTASNTPMDFKPEANHATANEMALLDQN